MKAVVTGCGGFIGSRVAAALASQGFEVLGIDSFTNYYDRQLKERNLENLRLLGNFNLLEDDLVTMNLGAALDGRPVVFHLAGQPGVRGSWGSGFSEYLRNNVTATQRLLEACLKAHVQKFVYSSSSSVYGDAKHYPTTEQDLTTPRSPYGVTKLAGENLVSLYASEHGLKSISLRYFTVYGGGQRPDMAINRLIRSVTVGETFRVFGDGSQVRDFTHVTDVVRANLLAASVDCAPGEILNVAGGNESSLMNLISLVEEAAGGSANLEWMPKASGDVAMTRASIERTNAVLNWKPEVALEMGIVEQVEYQQR